MACTSHAQEIELWNSYPIPNEGHSIQRVEHHSKNGSVTGITIPRLRVYSPTQTNNHAAILVISGGGYAHEELGHESTPTAKYFQQQGFTVFELIYRLPREGWTSPLVPFQDGQRAMRMIRSKASEYQFDPNKIGVLGFSAGGHLAGILATSWNIEYYSAQDQIDQFSARPDFAALIYPVISMMPPMNHTHAYKSLFNQYASLTSQKALSVQLLVQAATPPTFLAQAKDDPISPVENSILMHQALDKNHVYNKIVLFRNGGHSWGLGKKETDTTRWPDLFMIWLKQIKVI